MAASSIKAPADPKASRRLRRRYAGILAALPVTLAVFWWTELPLGVDGEWTWQRLDHRSTLSLLGSLTIGGLATAAYLGIVTIAFRSLERVSQAVVFYRLAAISVMGFIWLSCVQQCGPPEYVDAKSMWVLYDPSSSGYFFEVCYRVPNLPEFLANYENRMSQGDVLHVGTHPPGLFLFHEFLLEACQRSQSLTDFSLWTSPSQIQDTFQFVERSAQLHPIPLTSPQRAALWLAVQTTQACAILTLFPVYLLLRTRYGRQTSLLVAALWPLTPALAVFLPKSDALYPLIGTTFLVLWLAAQRRHSRWLALAAGLVMFCGLSLSLALLPLVIVAGVVSVMRARNSMRDRGSEQTRPDILWRLARDIGWALAGFGIPVLSVSVLTDLDFIPVWHWNLKNHAAFYGEYERTYWKWLLINPVEAALAIGLPVTWMAVWSSLYDRTHAKSAETVAWSGTWGLLWLSGKTMGEAARLWIVMYPGALWMAAPVLDREAHRKLRCGLLVLGIQASCTLATVAGVAGFHALRL